MIILRTVLAITLVGHYFIQALIEKDNVAAAIYIVGAFIILSLGDEPEKQKP